MSEIRIFNMHENTHRWLKANAAKMGITLNNYIKQILDKERKNADRKTKNNE